MLNIYRGRETVDKEKFIYSRIKEVGGRTIVIVPDQYTLVAEKQALSRLGQKVLLDIEILSLSRLGSRILSESGKDKVNLINHYGRHMMITKILRDENENLDAFKGMWNRENFVAAVHDFVAKAKQYNASPDEIEKKLSESHQSENPSALQRKLKDINLIFRKYQEEIAGKYTDAEDLISMYAEGVEDSALIEASHIWIYGFDSFTPKNLSFIGALMSKAKSVNIFLTWDKDSRDEDLFRLSEMVTYKLVEKAKDLGVKWSVNDLGPEDQKAFGAKDRSTGISIIERELFSVGITPAEARGAYQGVSIVECGSPYAEAEAAASHVLTMLLERNYHFSDILLICNDQSERGGIIKRVFQEYGIDIFDDKKRHVISSSLAVFITTMLSCMIYGFRAEDVMRALKTGLTDVTREEIIALEKYAYSLRIRGNMWKQEFTRGQYMRRYKDGGIEAIEEIRKKAIRPFIEFEKIYKDSKTYSEFILALQDYLDNAINVEEKMVALSEIQRNVGAPDVAEETKQLRDVVFEMLDQVDEIMGETPFDGKEFSDLIRAGLSQIEIGVLPPSADDMMLGTMQRTRAGDIKSLIVIGANDGILPLAPSDDILFSKEELVELEEEGITLGESIELRRMEEDLALYRCLFKPEEDLWISYSTAGAGGEAIQPSEIIDTIKKIFKDIPVLQDPNMESDISHRLGGATNTLKRYSEAMSDARMGLNVDNAWALVEEWIASKDQEEGTNNLRTIEENLEFENVQNPIDGDISDYLFGNSYSPSRLEKYSKCPFAHFVSYGLRAEEDEVDEATAGAIGTLYHAVLEDFAAELTDKNIWDSVTKEETEKMIDEFARARAESYNEGVFTLSGVEEYLFKRTVASSQFVAWTLVEQARAGEIKDSRYEVRFGRGGESGDGRENLKPIVRTLPDGRKVYIEGIIDRLDTLKSDKVKIIDYKSGSVYFDVGEVQAGYKLQLMLYLEAACEEKRKPAGVFYFLINEPRATVEKIPDEQEKEALDQEIRNKSQMDGILLSEEDAIREVAGEFDDESTVVKIKRTKNGFHKYSEKRLVSAEEFEELRKDVQDITSEICTDILEGRIEIKPKKLKGVDPCRYCGYRSICNFDLSFKGCNYEYI